MCPRPTCPLLHPEQSGEGTRPFFSADQLLQTLRGALAPSVRPLSETPSNAPSRFEFAFHHTDESVGTCDGLPPPGAWNSACYGASVPQSLPQLFWEKLISLTDVETGVRKQRGNSSLGSKSGTTTRQRLTFELFML